jgi:hypothetical protein
MMNERQPRYSKDEHAKRGAALYETRVQPLVEPNHDGRVVAVDVDTGEYEVGDDTLTAAQALLNRVPDAQIWCVRVGRAAVHRFGASLSRSRA